MGKLPTFLFLTSEVCMIGIKINVTDVHINYMKSNSYNYSKYIRGLIDFDIKNSGNKIPKLEDEDEKMYSFPPPPPPIEEIEQPPIPDDDGHEYYVHQKIKHPPKPLTPGKKKEVDRLKTLVGKFDLRKALEESDEDNKKK